MNGIKRFIIKKAFVFIVFFFSFANADDIVVCEKAINYFENQDKIWSSGDNYLSEELVPFSKACGVAVKNYPDNTDYKVGLALLLGRTWKREEAEKVLQVASEQGSDKAKAILLDFRITLARKQKDATELKQALFAVQDMAKSGNTDALSTVAVSLLIKDKVLKYRQPELISWIEQGAENGDRILQWLLGQIYSGFGKFEESARWYLRSAIQGNAEAGKGLINYFLSGLLSDKVKVKLEGKMLAQAEAGNPYAQNLLAEYYFDSLSIKKSMKWRVKAAENGNVHSQYVVAEYYFTGDAKQHGIEKDLYKALHYYTEAANKGSKAAKLILSMIEK